MKGLTLVVMMLTVMMLAACGGSATSATAPEQDSYKSAHLDASYEGALSVRNQLILGALELDGAPNAVAPEQARTLLPLWQALKGATRSSASAQAEVNALLGQIEGAMKAEQLAAIRAMRLTQTSMQTWAAARGITMGSGGGQTGSGQGLSPEARAARQAAAGRAGDTSGNNGASEALLDAIIVYLQGLNR